MSETHLLVQNQASAEIQPGGTCHKERGHSRKQIVGDVGLPLSRSRYSRLFYAFATMEMTPEVLTEASSRRWAALGCTGLRSLVLLALFHPTTLANAFNTQITLFSVSNRFQLVSNRPLEVTFVLIALQRKTAKDSAAAQPRRRAVGGWTIN